MTAEPLVSIITPAYNSAGFIRETIASALAQTLRNFELIVVDDGSSDDTIEVVHRIAAGDPRVIVMLSPHGGPAQARNVGLEAARGRYIALLDSDDIWMPQYLEQQIAVLERTPDCAIVTSNAINRGSALDGRTVWPRQSGLRTLSLRDLIVRENSVCIMAVFHRRVVSRIGPFDRAFTGNEDYEFWIRAANAGFGIVQNGRPLGYYRRREGSVSADEVRMIEGILRVFETASRMTGPIQHERVALDRQRNRLRQELLKAQMRTSLANHDAATAAQRLRTLSELRGSWHLAFAARIMAACPGLLRRAYDLRRSLRTS
jgi:glycosyltransferase involved in cell wall biosynthesis